jgi:geranylgeranyl reductase family protein
MSGVDVEVVVAGAGPAGSAAALVMARAGRHVLLVDRSDFPRDKVCGDLLGCDAVASLERLEVHDATLAGALPLAGAVLHGPRGTRAGSIAPSGREPIRRRDARVLPRRIFDARLLACARAAGAHFTTARVLGTLFDDRGAIAGVRTSAGDVRARVTIGAEGWGSPVARALGRKRAAQDSVAIVMRAYATGVAELARRMHFFINPAVDGYGWVFPLADGGANVGLGFIGREADSTQLRAAFERFIASDSPARALLSGSHAGAPVAWPIPLGWRDDAVATEGAFLAGDAAALASPLSGSGIHHALESGRGAARFALRTLAGDEHAWRGYAPWIRRRFGVRLDVEGALHRLAGTPQRVEPWLALARAVPGAGGLLSRALLALG